MLSAATEHGIVAPLFVFDPALLRSRWSSPNRNAWLVQCVSELRQELRTRGAELFIRYGDPVVEVSRFAADVGAGAVYCSRDYTPYSRKRDSAVARVLGEFGITFHPRRGTLVHEPEDVSPGDERPLSVFTPFYKRWQAHGERALLPAPKALGGALPNVDPGDMPGGEDFKATATTMLRGGERAAALRLRDWCEGGLDRYAADRDLLAGQTTSRLSQDLHFGTLSPLQVIRAARDASANTSKFVSEVAWREFYHYILWFHPRVTREPFQQRYAGMRWAEDPEGLAAWKEGRTGYPVVDAAMRQLLATGYMHNRARMIVASFLTKDLLIDWREGEAHFMRHLVDGDVANNNGGWQWAASTGTDPQPYFRIFNPVLQGKRHDPEGEYVRQWIPELRSVPEVTIHEPWTLAPARQEALGVVIGRDYPFPIVDHREARARALEAFGAMKGEPGEDR